MGLKSFFRELKRRNIYRVVVVYGITGWILVQIASIAANTFGAPTWVMKMIITLILLGFPIAMVLTWAFEVTPEGVQKTESETDGAKNLSDEYFWVGISIVVVILFAGWWYLTMEPTANTNPATPKNITDRSIAVLPLKSVSGSDKSLPLAEGLHDDLLTRLANVSDLKVISRTSVEKFQGSELTLPAIADSLGVKWIMEGNVQKGGSKVQINAQLIDPSTDTHIWAGTYQRDLNPEDIFAIQGAIAREITNALQVKLSAGEQDRIAGAPAGDLEAYGLYAQGRQELAQRTYGIDEHVKKAVDYFHRAIKIDSTFALAWSGLADAAASYYGTHPDTLSFLPVDQETAAERALELNPNLAEAHTSMAHVKLINMNAPAARRQLEQAVELKPSYWEAHHLLGELYYKIMRPEQALNHIKIATELNPQHTRARHLLYDAYNSIGEPEKSLEEARLQKKMGLERAVAIGGEVRALMDLKKYEQAQKLAEENMETIMGPWFKAYLVQITAAQGDTLAAQNYLNKLETVNVAPRYLAWGYWGLGKTQKAIETYQQLEASDWEYFGAMDGLRRLGENYPDVQQRPEYKKLIRDFYTAWGLNPDGSFPK